jgi:Icc-related predicted phosphoesterase
MTRICCISDTHSFHRKLEIPECDILVHSGDITGHGELGILDDFCEWLQALPVKDIVVIAGNHDFFERGHKRQPALDMLNQACHYIEDSSVEIAGLKFHGSPITPYFFDWSWNRQRGPDISRHWDLIPDDTDVLVTHGPPMGILDGVPRNWGDVEHIGCADLLRHLERLKQLKLHCFGHCHGGYGHIERNGIHFVNAASCTEQYRPTNPPIIIDL